MGKSRCIPILRRDTSGLTRVVQEADTGNKKRCPCHPGGTRTLSCDTALVLVSEVDETWMVSKCIFVITINERLTDE